MLLSGLSPKKAKQTTKKVLLPALSSHCCCRNSLFILLLVLCNCLAQKFFFLFFSFFFFFFFTFFFFFFFFFFRGKTTFFVCVRRSCFACTKMVDSVRKCTEKRLLFALFFCFVLCQWHQIVVERRSMQNQSKIDVSQQFGHVCKLFYRFEFWRAEKFF